MKLGAIKALDKKVRKEAQQALNAVYKKYNAEMAELIKAQIPEGHRVDMFNGMVFLSKGKKQVRNGKAWGFETENLDLDYIGSLQYTQEFKAGFTLPDKIKK